MNIAPNPSCEPVSRGTNGDAADYLKYALGVFRHTQELCGQAMRRSFVVGGLVVEINIAGLAMDRIVSRALAHLQTDHVAKPNLTLHVWDSDSTGAPQLQPKWNTDDYGVQGLIRGFNDGRFHAAMQFEPNILRFIDYEQGVGIYWTRSARELPSCESAAPLRPLFLEWLQRKGMLPIHGAAMGFKEGGVLVAGVSGAGKSNVALACLDSDLLYASDDFCVVSEDPWAVHSLYSSGRVHPDSLGRLPHLLDSLSNPERLETEKALFFLNDRFAGRLINTFPLRAILLPIRCPGQKNCLVPASPGSMQKALAMSTIKLSGASIAGTFHKVAALVRSLPCYELRIGGRSDEIPPLIASICRN